MSDLKDEVRELGKLLAKEAKMANTETRDKVAIFAKLVDFLKMEANLNPDEGEGDGWEKYRKQTGEAATGGNAAPAKAKSSHTGRKNN